MVSFLPDLPPPVSFFCIIAILIVYVTISYLVIDLISQDEEEVANAPSGSLQRDNDNVTYSHLSVEELQEITCVYQRVGANSTCAICLDTLEYAELCRVFPACQHEFHAQCIDPWLSRRLTCPVCRAPFRSKTMCILLK